MTLRNIKLVIAYDGSSYSGWQRQPDTPTIQQTVEEALEKLCGFAVKVNGASRTDAGVSALGQTANIKLESPVPTENLPRAITRILPDEIAVVSAEEVDPDFDAITDAKNKHYRYSICTSKTPPVLRIRHCWHRQGKLDVQDMDKAAKMLVGEKDFKSFASAADTRLSSVRTVGRCDVSEDGDWIYVDIEGNGFLYNMVRNITGTLIEIGRGRWTPEKIEDILAAKDRTAAGPLAPASGLCLMRIDYRAIEKAK
jgi:tRNA pseudouridine38-40 synthase